MFTGINIIIHVRFPDMRKCCPESNKCSFVFPIRMELCYMNVSEKKYYPFLFKNITGKRIWIIPPK